jgi:autotransporter adhesin
MYVGLAPTTTAIGTNSITLSGARSNAICVASGVDAIAIGRGARATETGALAIGNTANRADALGISSIAIGTNSSANSTGAVALGGSTAANAVNATAIGFEAGVSLRSVFATRPFNAIYWNGSTTNATPLILNLDAAANNRFTIAASTALAVDILLVARRSDTQDKWLVARRFLGIRRDGSNNTSLIGSVQTLGTDQSDGSPSWTFALTADDTNEALQLEVTGAASETIQWRATAFYRVA